MRDEFEREPVRIVMPGDRRSTPSVTACEADEAEPVNPSADRNGALAGQGVCARPSGLTLTELVDTGVSRRLEVGPPSTEDNGAWILILQLDGRSLLLSGENVISLDPGDLALVPIGIPLRWQTAGNSQQIRVRLPDVTIGVTMSAQELVAPYPINGATRIGMVLRSLIHSLMRIEMPVCEREKAGIADAVGHLASVACYPGRARCLDRGCGRRTSREGREHSSWPWINLQRSIESLLPDPELNPAMVASSHRISTRHLHRLFKRAGTSFSRYVRSRRLAHCRDDLTDPRFDGLPLTEIAYRWGFSDSSHFSRCFKEAFGCTARDFRDRERSSRANLCCPKFAPTRMSAGQAREEDVLPRTAPATSAPGSDGASFF